MTWQLGKARILAIGRRVEAALTHLELSDHERGLLHMTLVCGSLGGRRLDWLESSSIVAPDLIDPAPHPVDHAHAVLMASWGLALADTDRAVTMSSEAAQQAADAGAHRLAAMCHGYCVSHLPVGGRLEEALALVPGVQDALAASSDGFDQADASFSAVLGALFVLTEPTRSLDTLRSARELYPSVLNGSSTIGEAIALASLADVGEMLETLSVAEREYELVGEDGLPDKLLAPIALAWRLGEHDRASIWLTAIRHAAKPTQNFLLTSIYRRRRDQVGLAADLTVVAQSLGTFILTRDHDDMSTLDARFETY
ncbi:MAG: hypothetical protein P8N02_02140 [Actinomycetota bacterium]|nr:hypothetical protein [Actinomycetota bacterium]